MALAWNAPIDFVIDGLIQKALHLASKVVILWLSLVVKKWFAGAVDPICIPVLEYKYSSVVAPSGFLPLFRIQGPERVINQ